MVLGRGQGGGLPGERLQGLDNVLGGAHIAVDTSEGSTLSTHSLALLMCINLVSSDMYVIYGC